MLSKIVKKFAEPRESRSAAGTRAKPTVEITASTSAASELLGTIFEHLELRMRLGRLPVESQPRLEELEARLAAPMSPGRSRRWKRFDVALAASITSGEHRYRSAVLDVCAGGFRIRAVERLVLGAPVRVEVLTADGTTYCFGCRVQWIDGARKVAGLHLCGVPCPAMRQRSAASAAFARTASRTVA